MDSLRNINSCTAIHIIVCSISTVKLRPREMLFICNKISRGDDILKLVRTCSILVRIYCKNVSCSNTLLAKIVRGPSDTTSCVTPSEASRCVGVKTGQTRSQSADESAVVDRNKKQTLARGAHTHIHTNRRTRTPDDGHDSE